MSNKVCILNRKGNRCVGSVTGPRSIYCERSPVMRGSRRTCRLNDFGRQIRKETSDLHNHAHDHNGSWWILQELQSACIARGISYAGDRRHLERSLTIYHTNYKTFCDASRNEPRTAFHRDTNRILFGGMKRDDIEDLVVKLLADLHDRRQQATGTKLNRRLTYADDSEHPAAYGVASDVVGKIAKAEVDALSALVDGAAAIGKPEGWLLPKKHAGGPYYDEHTRRFLALPTHKDIIRTYLKLTKQYASTRGNVVERDMINGLLSRLDWPSNTKSSINESFESDIGADLKKSSFGGDDTAAAAAAPDSTEHNLTERELEATLIKMLTNMSTARSGAFADHLYDTLPLPPTSAVGDSQHSEIPTVTLEM